MTTVAYAHIEIAPDGIAYIADTKTKVEEIVLDHLAHGWEATEIHRQHPHLSLAEIHSALAYYYDHRSTMDAIIEDGLHQVIEIRKNLPPSSIRAKMKVQGLLP